jgi:hypothetical protein
MVKSEKRSFPRFKTRPGAHILYVEGTGEIRDLSLDGVFVLDPDLLPAGTKITFSLRLGNDTVALQGIVSRSVPQEGMGIQFTEMSPEARGKLRLHIFSLRTYT